MLRCPMGGAGAQWREVQEASGRKAKITERRWVESKAKGPDRGSDVVE